MPRLRPWTCSFSLLIAACGASGSVTSSPPPIEVTDPSMSVPANGDPNGDAGVATVPDAATASDGSADSEPAVVDAEAPADAATDAAADGGVVIVDPFDPASCDGPSLTSAEALTILHGASRTTLASSAILERSRSCTGDTCGAWGPARASKKEFLTYSGGSVTDYKTFTLPTDLVLFASSPPAGRTPAFSIRHPLDVAHDAARDDRGVRFDLGASPMRNTYPVIYVWDPAPARNRYDNLSALLGSEATLHASQHCARLHIPLSRWTEMVALYTY